MSPHKEPTADEYIAHMTTASDTNSESELRATLAMCRHCFDVVVQRLHGIDSSLPTTPDAVNETTAPEFIQDLQDPHAMCPLFVTWDKRRRRHDYIPPASFGRSYNNDTPTKYELRGCIGSLTPQPLAAALGHYALASAFQDKRFSPIQLQEVTSLRVAVSLLVKYETCQHVWDWVVGTHGIVLTWNGSGRKQYSSTYLPEVAAEQKWDQKTAVESLIRKAGWTAPVTDALLQTIQCTRYQSSKLRLTFEEYMAHCKAAGGDAALLVDGIISDSATKVSAAAAAEGKGNDCRIS